MPIRVLTWHVHGNYLLYLSRAGVDFYLPVRPGVPGYGGRGETFPFGPNVHDVPAEAVRDLDLDCVLFQTRRNYEQDQYDILSDEQRRLPRICLEHDPPWGDPTQTRHWYDDPGGLLVHVTPFNALMWDSGRTPTRVIEHGVFVPDGARHTGELTKGIVVVNHLRRRGRRLGADVFARVREEVPLDLVGMDAESLGGLGEVFPPELPAFEARYRFFFNPIRYTSLGLAVVEAMTVGLPVVGLATTEMATAVENGVSGFVDTDPARLVDPMRMLLGDAGVARRLGQNARRRALERFGIGRFARDWERAFADVTGRRLGRGPAVAAALAGGAGA
jgi:glycosyltransferase involved in cell wall biosynthesis